MKLQRQLSKKTPKKSYYRYTINLQEDLVKEAGFKEGDELQAIGKNGEIKLKKSSGD